MSTVTKNNIAFADQEVSAAQTAFNAAKVVLREAEKVRKQLLAQAIKASDKAESQYAHCAYIYCACCGQRTGEQCDGQDRGRGFCASCIAEYGIKELCTTPYCTTHYPKGTL